MRRALVMMCVVSLTLQAQTLSPFGEGRALADFLVWDAFMRARMALSATTARLERFMAFLEKRRNFGR